MDALWRGAVGVVPLGILAGLLVRFLHCRPVTKHCMWATVLAWALVMPLLPNPPQAMVEDRIEESNTDTPTPIVEYRVLNGEPHESNSAIQELEKVVTPPRQKARTVPVAPASLAQADGAVGLPNGGWKIPWNASIAESAIRGSGTALRAGLVTSDDAVCREEVAIAKNAPIDSQPNPMEFKTSTATILHGTNILPQPIGHADELKANEPPTVIGPWGSIQIPIPNFAGGPGELSTGKWSSSGLRQAALVPQEEPFFAIGTDRLTEFAAVVRTWYADLAALTSGVMAALPPVPVEVWTLGIVLLFCAKVMRIVKCRSLLRRTRVAPASVVTEVYEVASALGMRRIPRVLMVDANVSPMVWCGRGVRLLLPLELWGQLDATGRRAVLCHELAHLKRRDHWMLWLDQLAAVVYWWHPVVWWVRRRVHEEAENSCDAWVTWLLPQGRRAYAQALLRTTQFLHNKTVAAPIAGIGVVSGRAERFARRIRMVMTESAKPRLSGAGVVLALTLALGGWFAAPARSCPEDKHQELAKAGGGCCGKCAQGCAKKACAHGGHEVAASAGVAKLAGDHGEGHGEGQQERRGELEERLNKLESDLERLTEQLERIGDKLGDDDDDDAPKMKRRRGPGGSANVLPTPPTGAWEVLAPPLPPTPLGADNGPIVVRAYQLAPGKLEAVAELMVRPDVPIRVRPLDGRIEVQASERNQAIFKGFVDLISDNKQVRAYRVSPAKLEHLNTLMVRSDIPILVEPGREVIKLHGSSLEQSVFGAFIEMIDPGASVREAGGPEITQEPAAPRAPRMPREPRAPRGASAGGHKGPCGGNPEKCREMELKLSQAIRQAQEKAQSGVRKLEESQQRLRERTREQRQNGKQKREKRAEGESIETDDSDAAMEETVERLSEVIDVNKINQLIEVLAATDVKATLASEGEQRAQTEQHIQHLLEQAEVLETQARDMDEQAQQLDAEGMEIEAHAEALREEGSAMSEQAVAERGDAAAAEIPAESRQAELEMRAELLRAEAMAVAEQGGALQGVAESLYQQAEALQEAAEALHSTVQEDETDSDEEAEVEIEEG